MRPRRGMSGARGATTANSMPRCVPERQHGQQSLWSAASHPPPTWESTEAAPTNSIALGRFHAPQALADDPRIDSALQELTTALCGFKSPSRSPWAAVVIVDVSVDEDQDVSSSGSEEEEAQAAAARRAAAHAVVGHHQTCGDDVEPHGPCAGGPAEQQQGGTGGSSEWVNEDDRLSWTSSSSSGSATSTS